MNSEYRYQLESKRLTGRRQKKFQCPQCGRMKCLVRYVDTHHGCCCVADEVGKCDHQHSCGYHYTPADYFRDHPGEARQQCVATQSQPRFYIPPLPPFQPLPMELVSRSHSPRSTFWQWLTGSAAQRLAIPADRLQAVYDDYQVGATRCGDVIFWQIDHRQRVHGGHIMHYRTDGHRDGYQGWTHVPLIRQGLLPLDWQLYQCLYGQHLLTRRPEAHVCVVESEKTALVMACLRPRELWLATGGSGGLTAERVACLRGRRVTIFPDSGCYEKWSRQMRQTDGIPYNISSSLEAYAPNTDLCDLLLGEARPP